MSRNTDRKSTEREQKITAAVRTALVLLVAFSIAGVFFNMLLQESTHASDRRPDHLVEEDFSEGWVLETEEGDVSLPELPVNVDVGNRETFRIRNILPENEAYDHLMLWNKGQDVRAYVDGDMIFLYDSSTVDTMGTDRPYSYLMIELPDHSGGKEITLELNSVAAVDAGRIGSAAVGQNTSLLISVFRSFQFEIVAAMTLLVIAMEMMARSLFLRVFVKKQDSLLYLGLSIFVVSFWILADSRLRQFVFPNVSAIRNAAFFAVPLMPTAAALYIDHIQERKYRMVYMLLEAAGILVTAVMYILHKTELFGLSEISLYSQIFCLLSIVAMFATIAEDIYRRRFHHYLMAGIGLMSLAVCAVLQIIIYRQGTSVTSGMLMAVGLVLLMIFCTIQNFQELGILHLGKLQAEQTAQFMTVEAMESLARTVDARDLYTSDHSRRVAAYSRELAARIGLGQEEQEQIYYIGMLHDVGKIGIPDEIINKPGRLTEDEYKVIKTHPVIGARILGQLSVLPHLNEGVRYHHERYDGTGYPEGLSGENIPLTARIIAVADSYDAMTSNRSYRRLLPQPVARAEIEKNKGIQFDPEIADAMLTMIDEDTKYLLREHFEGEDREEYWDLLRTGTRRAEKPFDAVAAAAEAVSQGKNSRRAASGSEDRKRSDIGQQEGSRRAGEEKVPGQSLKQSVRSLSERLKMVMLYAGLDPEDYRRISEKEMTDSNYRVIRVFSAIAAGCIFFMLMGSFFSSELYRNRGVYLAGTTVSVLLFFASDLLYRRWPARIRMLLYIAVTAFFGYGFMLGIVTRPEHETITYMVLLIFVPLLFVDSPLRMSIMIILSDLVFILACFIVKTGTVLAADVTDALVFGILSIASNTFMMVTKINRFALERRLEALGSMDQLTGIHNRNGFETALSAYPSKVRESLTCIYIDVNGLHELNNREGHAAGDRMLQSVARELKAVFGQEHTYRIGGDEFVAFAVDQAGPAVSSGLYIFKERVSTGGYHVSIGSASQNVSALDMDELIRNAELDMYEAKKDYYGSKTSREEWR